MTTDPPAIAGFEAFAEIGRGGYGIVYRAWETALQRQVAIKMMWANLDPSARDRFTREGLAMSALSGHPNVLAIHQVGVTDEGHPYLVMPYLARGSLAQQLKASGDAPMPWADATRLAVRLAGALATAHAAGILHRDIKPDNVLLSDYGEPELADFGIARMTGGYETTAAGVTASVLHAAPEVLSRKPATALSDVYSLGSTYFTLLNGEPAFLPGEDEEIVALYVRVAREPVPDLRPAGVPDAICRTVEQAMEKDPSNRQPSAAAFGAQLQHAQHEAGVSWTEMAVTGDSGSPVKVVGAGAIGETSVSPSPVAAAEEPSVSAPISAPISSPVSAPALATSSPDDVGSVAPTEAPRRRGGVVAVAGAAIVVVVLAVGAAVVWRSSTSSSTAPTAAPTGSAPPQVITLSSTPAVTPFHLDTGQSRTMTFKANTGQRITGSVRFDPEPSGPVHVEARFNDASVVDQTSVGATVIIEPTVLQTEGAYELVVGPTPSPTDVVVELVEAVDPVEKTTTIGGPPVPIDLVQSRQQGFVSFDGKAGDKVQGQWTWRGQPGIGTTAEILDANENSLDAWSVQEGEGRGLVITLPEDGRYRMRVFVDGDGTGNGEASVRSG